MIADYLIFLGCVPLAVLSLVFALLAWKHYKVMKRLDFYEAQGMTLQPGARRFVLGNAIELMNWGKESYEIKRRTTAIDYARELNAIVRGEESFEADRYPVTVSCIFGKVSVSIQDPALVSELYTTKATAYDKGNLFLEVCAPLFGDAFIFSKTDAKWKTKR